MDSGKEVLEDVALLMKGPGNRKAQTENRKTDK
jgi:hypothetical protein